MKKLNPAFALKVTGETRYGTSLKLEAQAEPNGQGAIPSGYVQFMLDGRPASDQAGVVASDLVAGYASISVDSPNVGKHEISVAYAGDQQFLPKPNAAARNIEILPVEAALEVPRAMTATQGEPFAIKVRAAVGHQNPKAPLPEGFVRLRSAADGVVSPTATLKEGVAEIRAQLEQLGEYNVHVEYVAPAGGANFRVKPARLLLNVERPHRDVRGRPQDLHGRWTLWDGATEIGQVTFKTDQELNEPPRPGGVVLDFYLFEGDRLQFGLGPQRSPTGSSKIAEWGRIKWLDSPFNTRFEYNVRETDTTVLNAERKGRTFEFRWVGPLPMD
jgi:hypothetical protein